MKEDSSIVITLLNISKLKGSPCVRVKTCERRTRTDTFQMEQKLFSILHPPPKSSEVSIISPGKKKGKSSNLAKEGRVREKN